ncbi:Uncharacterized protein dnm_048530 [Desulfonema magnum]|uniref:Uncharacterized protein n=1 Tax=Desulfonema magnum TaxID=45655 RepID=A0A975BNN0_9BACT|nr:Uncharacterized protein dnm_048530 [Desulfonema magnum]
MDGGSFWEKIRARRLKNFRAVTGRTRRTGEKPGFFRPERHFVRKKAGFFVFPHTARKLFDLPRICFSIRYRKLMVRYVYKGTRNK